MFDSKKIKRKNVKKNNFFIFDFILNNIKKSNIIKINYKFIYFQIKLSEMNLK